MATPNPAGHQRYWGSGRPFTGVLFGSNDPGTQLFWCNGVPCTSLYGTVVETSVAVTWPHGVLDRHWINGRPHPSLSVEGKNVHACWVGARPVLDLTPPSGAVGSAAGAAVVTGVGVAIWCGVGAALGAAVVTAVSTTVNLDGVGAAFGVSSADAVSGTVNLDGDGVALGAAIVTAIGQATVVGDGAALGVAVVAAVGSTVNLDGEGLAAGAAIVTGVMEDAYGSIGSAAGEAFATAVGVAEQTLSAVGTALGIATATAVGIAATLVTGVGAAAGVCTAVAYAADADAIYGTYLLDPVYTDDGWGGALTYQWTQVAGTGLATIETPTTASTNVSFPKVAGGSYLFKIVVSNGLLTGEGYWRIMVLKTGEIITVPENVGTTTIYINGVEHSAILDTPTVSESLGGSPNTCSFRLYGHDVAEGSDIRLEHNVAGVLFAGTAVVVTQQTDEGQEFFDVQSNGYEWRMARRLVTRTFAHQSATDIAKELVALVPGFTSVNVQSNLPYVDAIDFKDATIPAALTQLSGAVEGAHWKVGYDKDVFFGTQDTALPGVMPLPITVTTTDLRKFNSTRDLSRVVNRVYVTGQYPPETTDDKLGRYITELQVDSLDSYESGGGRAEYNGQEFTYSGIETRAEGRDYNIQVFGFSQTLKRVANGQILPADSVCISLTFTTEYGESTEISGWSGQYPQNAAYVDGTWQDANAVLYRLENQHNSLTEEMLAKVKSINVYRFCHYDSKDHMVCSFDANGGIYLDVLHDADELTFCPIQPTVDMSGGPTTYWLTGVSGLTRAGQVVDGVKYKFTVNNTDSQTIMAAIFGDDGVVEASMDVGLVTRSQADIKARTFLAERDEVEITVKYTTRDFNARPGRVVTVNLPGVRNVVGDFKIQQTTITKFESGVPVEFSVTATKKLSLVRFESLLRSSR